MVGKRLLISVKAHDWSSMWSLLCLSLSMGNQPLKRWYFTISQSPFKIKTSASVVWRKENGKRTAYPYSHVCGCPPKTKLKDQTLKTTFHFLPSGPRLFLTFKPLRVPLTKHFVWLVYNLCSCECQRVFVIKSSNTSCKYTRVNGAHLSSVSPALQCHYRNSPSPPSRSRHPLPVSSL